MDAFIGLVVVVGFFGFILWKTGAVDKVKRKFSGGSTKPPKKLH
jgi:hypothetical protein